MFIKDIIISGFRSYSDQKFEPHTLSPRHNVIVGPNGSGKSNFFAAIQFVLGEKFALLRTEDRRKLFHSGGGRTGMTVSVEIVFDNSEGRLVIPNRPEEKEVRIRRTVGLKHDEYRVNNNKYDVTDVRQLLESAGLSSANPYYIVEQGQIVNLAKMQEEERYQLLKDIAGTKVYEKRRAESQKVLEESNGQMQKVDESIGQFDDRLRSLEQETAELKSFQEVDRRRRSLEGCIYQNEIEQAEGELTRLDAELTSQSKGVRSQRDAQHSLEAKARDAELKSAELGRSIQQSGAERKSIESERGSVANRKAVAELHDREFDLNKKRHHEERSMLEKEVEDLKKTVTKNKGERKTKEDLVARHVATLTAANAKYSTAKHRLEMLLAKRGRQAQFSNQRQRDDWLDEQIDSNQKVFEKNKKELARLDKDDLDLGKVLKADKEAADAMQKKSTVLESAPPAKRATLIKTRDELNANRRTLWQSVSQQENVLRKKQDEADRAKNAYEKVVRLDIRQGLKSMQETLHDLHDEALSRKVHGQLIDLMTFDAQYTAAIEATAGNVLFNVIVEDAATSDRLLKEMNARKKPGRITFFPLEGVFKQGSGASAKDIPNNSDISPLISHIRFDPKFKNAFIEVFGRTALARTDEVGVAYMTQAQCDVVTREGSQFNRKGAISGGYVDPRSVRVAAVEGLKKANADVTSQKAALDQLRQKVADVEQEITSILQGLDELASQDAAAVASKEAEQFELRAIEEKIARTTSQVAANDATRQKLAQQNEELTKLITEFRAEKGTAFKTALTAAEDAELEKLQTEAPQLKKTVDDSSAMVDQLQSELQLLNATTAHLERRLKDAETRIQVLLKVDVGVSKVSASFEADLQSLDTRLKDLEAVIERMTVERRKFDEIAINARRELVDGTKEQQDHILSVDKAVYQRSLWASKKEEAQQRLRRLGAVTIDPAHASFSVVKLMQQVKQVNEEMRKYDHVNKKALDQYTQVLETRNTLHERRRALVSEKESVNQLITHLEAQKGEAIERTYKQVQHNFEEVFKELVPTSKARLELVKPRAKDAEFSGVRIFVDFGLGTSSELSQLSGGQKSLVALALIFAIQRCDRAPFYLFDEIDAALDADYRASVARLLKKESEHCQFITATFKTEMLDVADHIYGISFTNRISSIDLIDKPRAAKVLREAALEERKRRREEDEE